MVPADETFDATWPFAARFHEVPATATARAFRMHYVDEGPPTAPPVLLVHGQPTWSYLYRTTVARLVSHGLRAVASDLVGFGRSDKPAARTAHSVEAHVGWMSQYCRK